MVMHEGKIVTDALMLREEQAIKTILKTSSFESTITQINIDDQSDF